MKPSDRSHYERFVSYHESFYREVEATSVTPFSGQTLDRGLGLVTLRSLDALTLLGVVGSALGRRRFLQRSRKVDLRTDLDGFSVRGHGPFPYQVDGDYLGEVELLELTHEPDALSLVVPPGTRW